MTYHSFRLCAGLSVCALLSIGVVPARARSFDDPKTPSTTVAPAPPAGQADADDDDDATLRPLEPDFTLINLPTTLPLPLHKGNFRLTHRFNGNLIQPGKTFSDDASSLFGIDDGAAIGFEYRFAVAKHVEAAAYRTNRGQTIQLYGKYDAFHQGAHAPLGFSAIVSIEGTNNFQQEYAPAIGASISRDLGNVVALYVVPMWVHNSAAALGGSTRDTGMIGLGGSLRVRPAVYLMAEVSPRISGFATGNPEYGFGVAMRVGGHVFNLTLTNAQGTTFAQMAGGGAPNSLYFGFNLARKFF